MMASNALSKRRGYKGRPDVCRTLPNPGRCDPPEPPDPTPCVCHFIPTVKIGYIHEEFQFDIHFCRNMGTGRSDVTIIYWTVGADWGGPPVGLDCQDLEAQFHPPEPGMYALYAQVTWTYDGYTCSFYAAVLVKPLP